MSRDFYENIIAQAENFGELKIIHKFLVCDLHIQGADHKYISRLIANREANILLDMQREQMPG